MQRLNAVLHSSVYSVCRWMLLFLAVSSTLRTVRAGKDVWHRPGCHKVGHTRTIEIPDCVQFTISTNACRGFCESFAVPTAPVAEGENGNSNTNAAAASGSNGIGNNGLPMGNNNGIGNGNHISVNGATILNRYQYQQSAHNKAAAGFLLNGGPFSSGAGGGGQLPLLGGAGGIERQQQQHMQLLSVTRRRAPTDKPVTSVGQCCNIMESEDVLVQVNCVNGPRNLTFKSATKCSCYHCKKD